MIRVDLPWAAPPLSPNGSRMHPHAHAGRVRGVLDAARYTIRNAQLDPIRRANVELHWRIPDKRRRDADNLLALLKPCLDALVQEGILKDDSFRYVPAVTCAIHEGNGEPASMWLILNEIPALVCAFALHRGAFCGRPAGHDGDHLPAGVEQ